MSYCTILKYYHIVKWKWHRPGHSLILRGFDAQLLPSFLKLFRPFGSMKITLSSEKKCFWNCKRVFCSKRSYFEQTNLSFCKYFQLFVFFCWPWRSYFRNKEHYVLAAHIIKYFVWILCSSLNFARQLRFQKNNSYQVCLEIIFCSLLRLGV